MSDPIKDGLREGGGATRSSLGNRPPHLERCDCGAVGWDDECRSGCGMSDEGRVDSDSEDGGRLRADGGGYQPGEGATGGASAGSKVTTNWERFKGYHSVRDINTGLQIANVCDDIKAMLLEKNKAYGNSAFEPIKVFSKGVAREQLSVRIDDKLSRIQRGSEYPGDDTILDLIGYLILYRIAQQEGM